MYHTYGAVLVNDDGKVLLRHAALGDGRSIWTFIEHQQDTQLTPEETALQAVADQAGHRCRILGTVPGSFTNVTGDFSIFFLFTPDGEQPPPDPALQQDLAWCDPDEAKAKIEATPSDGRRRRDLDVLECALAEYQARLVRNG
jgi:hypothetical protein